MTLADLGLDTQPWKLLALVWFVGSVWFVARRALGPLLWEIASDWCLTPSDPALGYEATYWTWLTIGDLDDERESE